MTTEKLGLWDSFTNLFRRSKAAASQETEAVRNWRVFGASVRGASHDQSGLPNQDAIGWWPEAAEGPPIILAVADGHGSPKCFRSQVGSQLAVDTAVAVLREFVEGQPDPFDPTLCKRAAEERLPEVIDHQWKQAVKSHLDEHPLLVDEVRKLEEKEGPAARKTVEDKPALAYGCTLLAVLVEATYVLCLQIGDGDICVVSPGAEAVRPIAEDPRHFAGETTSLSSNRAARDVQVRFQQLAGAPPALILAATDGYGNAFPSSQDLLDTAREFVEALRDDGLETVNGYLPELLTDASHKGSGDDVTVGMLFRGDAPAEEWPDWRSEQEEQKKAETEPEPATDNSATNEPTTPETFDQLLDCLQSPDEEDDSGTGV